MDPHSENEINVDKLTNDLVVKILSGVPFKSFCQFKCVSKTWLSFSSDAHYSEKLPKACTGGLLYQEADGNAIKLTNPCSDGPLVDTSLSFLPHNEQLELLDCCNGLLLCEYERSSSLLDISHLIVCNPVTGKWTSLPKIHREPDFHYVVKLAFNPSWSPHFYIFSFKEKCSPARGVIGVCAVEIVSSENSTWYMDDGWTLENGINITYRPHFFLQGVLYVHTSDDRVLVIEALHQAVGWNHRIIKLPGYKPTTPFNNCFYGCLGQSLSGVLHYAKQERYGCTIAVWSLEQNSWNLKHRLSMSDAFGRHIFIHMDWQGFWFCDYDIQVVDVDKGLIFLRDLGQNKLLSYCMNTRRLNEIQQDGFNRYLPYVPRYSLFQIKKLGSDEDLSEEL